MTPIQSLDIAKLVIYLALAPLALYCWIKHGKRGFLAFWYLNIFCGLRIATSAIGIKGVTGLASTILNSVGLSPLMLAAAGLLHESRRTCIPGLNKTVELLFDIKYHGIVGLGMVLIIIAIVNLENGKNVKTMEALLKAGDAISCVAWGVLVLWTVATVQSLTDLQRSSRGDLVHHGLSLLHAVIIALPLIAIRVGYGVAFLLLSVYHPKSSFLSSMAVQVCLNALPEILIAITYTYFGLKNRNFQKEAKEMAREHHHHHHHHGDQVKEVNETP